jgi:hypothetical protein
MQPSFDCGTPAHASAGAPPEITWCATCGQICPYPKDDHLVAFCSDCLDTSRIEDYPDDWVMLGGWD